MALTSSIICKRTFSTSLRHLARKAPPVQATTPETKNVLLKRIPPYPYGPNRLYKQANRGLYGGGIIQFGNKISQGKNEGKTRRTWSPNVNVEKLRSDALDKELNIKVRHRVLRTIRKVGGLDNYLLGEKPARIKELGVFGWKLRWLVMNAPSMRIKLEVRRRQLGLPPTERGFETFWKERKEEFLAERQQWLIDQEEERRARERRWEEAEKEEEEDEEYEWADEEQLQEQGTAVLKSEDKPENFMQEEMPVKERT